ncbi:DUF3857 domain-containing protein [Seonamhaeicola sp. MEBiC1930]|uniref:transglutaminase domain-containing protein n=1 Tax=Seonamhaeicola sp. MEBiC01930 TaxID=2976768 RepID=UPI0032519FCA
MKKIILSLLLLLSTINLFSQNTTSFNSESYEVTLGDLNTNYYSNDPTANALVIYEYGNSYVDKKEYDLTTEVKHKIKIFNREGFDNATVSIYLYKTKNYSQQAQDIIGITYNNIEGKLEKSQLSQKDVFRENYNEKYDIIKFTLPNIQEGSVITYSYKIISKHMFKYQGWEFQGEIPKLYSEYNASIPGNWLYHKKLVGSEKLAINESKIEKHCIQMFNGAHSDCAVSRYAMKNVPAFIEEDYMTTKDNYLARIEYELETFKGMDGTIKHYTKTWETVDKEFKTNKEIGKELRKKLNPEDLLNIDIISEKDDLKKAKSIYEFVQKNYTWNEQFRVFSDVSVKDLLKDKSGNVSSINILLHNLLKECQIEVNPILLSTRKNGFPTTIFPVLLDFNYQIVQATIQGKTYLLDATDKYLSFGEIPFRCLNQKGRLIDFNAGSKWIDIIPKRSDNIYEAKLKIDENNNIVGTIQSKRTGQHGYESRRTYFKNRSAYIENLENKSINASISNFEIGDCTPTSSFFREKYDIKYTGEEMEKNIYINPFFIKPFKDNPFKLQERSYPVDFGYADSFYYILRLDIGDSYEFIEKPKPIMLNLPHNTGTFSFTSEAVGSKLTVSFRVNFKEPIYPADYYPYLKEFMNKIIDIQNNSLILLKKLN